MDSETPITDPDTTAPTDAATVATRTADEAPSANRRTRVASALMALGLATLVASAVLFTVPVTSPGVQHCGSPAWFLLHAESNRPLVDTEGDAINGWNNTQLRHAYANRCSVQVARRAVPAGILLGGFWIVVLGAFLIGWNGRRSLHRNQPGRTTRIGVDM